MGAHLLRVRLKTSINTGHGERGAVQGISVRTGSCVVVAVRMRRMSTIVAFLLPVFIVVQIYSYYYYYCSLLLSLFIISFMQRIYIYILEETVFLENIIVVITTTTTTTTASLVTVLFSLVLLFLNKL